MKLNVTMMMAAAALACSLAACSVHESGSGDNKNVDIKTPMGSMSVKSDKEADPKQTGIGVYPGATQVADEEGKKNANVNMSFGGFGLKVAAANYSTGDSPQKVMDFYKKELSKYGTVLVCDANSRRNAPEEKKDSDVLTCNDSHGNHISSGDLDKEDTELKVGTQHRQHIVSLKPKDGGTHFALVYVEVHGGKQDTM